MSQYRVDLFLDALVDNWHTLQILDMCADGQEMTAEIIDDIADDFAAMTDADYDMWDALSLFVIRLRALADERRQFEAAYSYEQWAEVGA